MWQWLISLKFEVTVSRDEQITKQLEASSNLHGHSNCYGGWNHHKFTVNRQNAEGTENQ